MLHGFTDMDEELLSWKSHFGISDAAHESLQNILPKYGMPSGHVQRVSDEEMLAVKERSRPDEPLYYSGPFTNAQAGSSSPKSFAAGDIHLTHDQSFLAESFSAGNVPLTHVRKLCQDRQCRHAAHVG